MVSIKYVYLVQIFVTANHLRIIKDNLKYLETFTYIYFYFNMNIYTSCLQVFQPFFHILRNNLCRITNLNRYYAYVDNEILTLRSFFALIYECTLLFTVTNARFLILTTLHSRYVRI